MGISNNPWSSCEIVCSDTNRDEWLQARKTGIGASESASLLFKTPWASPTSIYYDKTSDEITDRDDSEAMFWGRELEGPIVEGYRSRFTKNHVTRSGRLFRHKSIRWALATLDAIEFFEDAAIPVEIKNLGGFSPSLKSIREGVIPDVYHVQIQHQLLVTDADRGVFCPLLNGNDLLFSIVPRCEKTINRIVEAGSRLWDQIERRTPPPLDGHAATRRALHSVNKNVEHASISLGEESANWLDDLRALKTEKKRAEEAVQAFENKIKAAMGHHVRATIPGGGSFSWKPQGPRKTRVLRGHDAKN